MSEPASELLAPLLRALWAGHPSHRGRVLRALERYDDATLSGDPVASTFRRLLGGESLEQLRHVGELIARRRLSAYTPELLELLRGGDELRARAERWLGRVAPAPEDLIALAVSASAPLEARAAALRLLGKQQSGAQEPLSPELRRRLLPTLAERELHEPLLAVLGAEIEEGLVDAAVAANEAYGARLRGARDEGGLWSWLFPARPSSLGVWREVPGPQRDFVLGIAQLAARAKHRRWLTALVDYLHEPGFSQLLERCYVELDLRDVASAIQGAYKHYQQPARAARSLRLLGLLRHQGAASALRLRLPKHGAAADEVQREALLALARLGEGAVLAPYLEGVAAAFRRHLGQREAGAGVAPAHPSLWRVGLEAGAELRDPTLSELSLALLRAERPLEAVARELPPALVRFGALELSPTLEAVLGDPRAPDLSKRQAIRCARASQDRRLCEALAALAAREPAHADAAGQALARLAGAEELPLLRRVLGEVTLGDDAARRLFARLGELAEPEAVEDAARELLAQGQGGRRTQRAVLRFLGEVEAPGAFLRTCVGLLGSPHEAVRTQALKEALKRDLLQPADEARARAASEATGDLLALTEGALVDYDRDEERRRQANALLEAILPGAGVGALDGAECRELKRRLRTLGHFVEVATFHALHRELLEVARLAATSAAEGEQPSGLPDVGLAHGVVLQRLARLRFRHPQTNQRQRYWGPLPRFDETFAHPSPFVQEALFELVASPNYLRTDGLVARFLASPRARVRAAALGHLSREGTLVHSAAALALREDPDPAVRRALVERLRALELGRFAPELQPLLEDPHEGVRLAATRTLAEWGDAGCLGALSAFLESEDLTLRREASATLRRFDPAHLVGLLAPLVQEERPLAAAAALAALRPDRLPEDPALAGAIFQLAAEGRGPLRARALRFLPALATPERLGEVVPLLDDADSRVRAAAAAVLRRRDGRRHAGAIATRAAETQRPEVRRELLALLADLGVAETAKGLLPLLLDEDRAVRAEVRRAALGVRAFSLQADLEALLARGLDEGASPAALAELVALLDRLGDAELSAPWVAALRCELREVWSAALRAVRARGPAVQGALLERLEELLLAEPALPADLIGLGLRELERLGARERPGAQRALTRWAAQGERTTRRKALELSAAWGLAGAEDGARELAEVALAQVEALEREASKSGQAGAKDVRALLTRARADLCTGQRLLLDFAAARGPESLTKAAKALPQAARRGGRVPGALLRHSAVAWRERPGLSVKPLLDALPSAKARPGRLHPWAAGAALLRDRLSPGEWLERVRGLEQELRPRDLIHAQLWAKQPVDARAWVERIDHAQWSFAQLEDHLFACMVHFDEGLKAAFPRQVARAKAFVDGLPDDRWGGKERRRSELGARYVHAKLRLGIEAPTPGLAAMLEEGLQLRLLAAEDDVAGLRARLDELKGNSKAGERAQVMALLGEVGTSEAAELLAARACDEGTKRTVRREAGRALRRLRPEAREVVPGAVSALLASEDVHLRAAGLEVVAALGLSEQRGAVLKELSAARSGWNEAGQQALAAARALELSEAAPALLELARGGPDDARKAALGALGRLAGAEQSEALVALFLEGEHNKKTLRGLARTLSRVVPEGQLARLTPGLGAAPKRLIPTLSVLAERVAEAAAGAALGATLEDLLEHPALEVREAACDAAGALRAQEAADELGPQLRALLADPKQPLELRQRALRALAQGQHPEAARALLSEHLRGPLAKGALEGFAQLPAAIDEAVAQAALERLRDQLAPGLRLPEPGEPAEAFSERLSELRLAGFAKSEGVRAPVELLLAQEPRGAALAAAEQLLWAAAGEGNYAEVAWAGLERILRAEGAEGRVERLVETLRSLAGDRRSSAYLGALLREAPVRALPFVLQEDRRYLRLPAKRRILRALSGALAAGQERWRGPLREWLLESDAEVRWEARLGLDPGRRAAPDPEDACD